MSKRSRGRPPHPDVLTPAEWAVLDLHRHGLDRSTIARLRDTSVEAVRFHLRNVRDKLGAASVRQLRSWPGFASGSPLQPSALRSRSHQAMDSQLSLGPIGQISLLCRSAPATEAWYRDTLKLPHLFTFGGLVFFECAGTRLYFREVPDADWRSGSTIYFDVPDIQVAYQLLIERGVAFLGAPHLIHRHADGSEEWMAFFADSDGNTLALMTTATPETTRPDVHNP